jgi:hypothetical protein
VGVGEGAEQAHPPPCKTGLTLGLG